MAGSNTMFLSKVCVRLCNLIFLINLVLGKGVNADRERPDSPPRDHLFRVTVRSTNRRKGTEEGSCRIRNRKLKNKVSEGIVYLDSEGLGLAHLKDIQEDAKTQTSFKYSWKCHISSAPAELVVLCRDHGTFKYHIPHEKYQKKNCRLYIFRNSIYF